MGAPPKHGKIEKSNRQSNIIHLCDINTIILKAHISNTIETQSFSCSLSDGWDESWCIVENDNCDTANGSGDEAWIYCIPSPGAVSIKQQPRTQNVCTCKRYWSSDDGGRCGSTQYGCPSTACDDNDPISWCIVDDPNCESAEIDDGVAWSYCEADACVCKDKWSYSSEGGCKTDQYGCPVEACDGYHKTWCAVEDGNCATAEEDDGVSWSYCGTGLEEEKFVAGWWSV